MANAIQKITLSASRDIIFNKLMLSQANVQRVKASVQSLTVRPVVDARDEPPPFLGRLCDHCDR